MPAVLPHRVAACDLGQYGVRLALGSVDERGSLRLDAVHEVAHDGRPLEALAGLYREGAVAGCAVLGATGMHASELGEPVAVFPEGACLEAALPLVADAGGALNVVRVGARGYSALSRDAGGQVEHAECDKCSSGTGETMIKIAARFGLSLAEADALAVQAEGGIPITARCSVFAKSEMTHHANQGEPAGQLFRGYFASVAGNAAALLARIRVTGPILLVGRASRLRSLRSALSAALGQDVEVPEQALHLEALGALALALETLRERTPAPLPDDPAALFRARRRPLRVLEPARGFSHLVRRLAPPAPGAGGTRGPAVLGLDLGSTGAKAVLTALETAKPVLSIYERTQGNPVQAAGRLLQAVMERAGAPDVRALGLTGSGREAAAALLRAAYPESRDRIVVLNEIVAHATAAIRCDEARGRSLSVVEIGGQDAKFIQIAGGQIVESDMNKACSAGTGSFLEEQAALYGVHDMAELARLAEQAARPPDLGQMCTVFVAEAAADALLQGLSLADLLGGFEYAVVHNYLHRVVGQRALGERIFFQGKPASSRSLAWTLAAVTGREVIVPADPGAMGAWGIGLCALGELGAQRLLAATAFDLRATLGAAVVGRRYLQCRDKRCGTYCRIERTTVQVAGRRTSVLSGGACPKYERAGASRPKLPRQAPSAFDERARLLAPWLAGRPGHPMVGVPLAGACHGYLPWLVELCAGLGLGVRVLAPARDALARGERLCHSYDACAPAKIAHGAVDTDLDLVLFPRLLSRGEPGGPGGTTCPMQQALPDMLQQALAARRRPVRIVQPALGLREGLGGLGLALVPELASAARELGVGPGRVPAALRAAAGAQQRYEAELVAIGQRTLGYARALGLPVVVVCGALHVIHDELLSAGIPRMLREGGALGLPVDCFPVPAEVHAMPPVVWQEARRTLRAAVAAQDRGDVYPLLLTAFGCGPSSFAEQIFGALCEGHPHTVLESDGHGGTAGYVTRVQAFLHAVHKHDRRSRPAPQRQLRLLEPLPHPPLVEERGSRLVLFGMADRIGSIVAAAYRSLGFDAAACASPDAAALALGRRDCSGKECLPYQLIWGCFRRHLAEQPPVGRTVLLQVTGAGRCRNCLFSAKDLLSLDRLGLSATVASRRLTIDTDPGLALFAKIWTGVVLWDLVFELASYHRATERRAGEIDRLYAELCTEIERLAGRPYREERWQRASALAGDGAQALALAERASQTFARLGGEPDATERGQPRSSLRTVLLSGDAYVRLDAFANADLVRKLSERGLRVIVEPSWMFFEYFYDPSLESPLAVPRRWVGNAVAQRMMRAVRRSVYARALPAHPWLPTADTADLLRAALRLLAGHPQGEAVITLGSVLHTWRAGACDGVVVASPWGCAPALVGESLLRHQRQIPALFVYADGSPVDERRLDAFAFRLRREPARARFAAPGE
ncbi:MAG: hypothetical protein HY744_32200 [Deltaproteobacteria bacterium]|nr:hypothetical protein [Deltaproteobacteria bacterium]